MHTRGDTMIFVEEDRVLFTGDVVMSQRFLAAQNTSSIPTWISTLDELAALRPMKVVPSHGSIGDATLIARDRAFLQAGLGRPGAIKPARKSRDQAVAAGGGGGGPQNTRGGHPPRPPPPRRARPRPPPGGEA